MSDKMTAAVLYAPGDIRVEQVDIPQLSAGEVLVKVAACGVCGSDISRMNTTGAYRHPIICGHEFSGHIVKLGDDVTGLDLGQLVTVPPLIPCGNCDSCRVGNYSLCADYGYYGSRQDGAYAEYVAIKAVSAFVMPPGIDPRAAAMMDPSAIALHAVYRTQLGGGSRVAVVGAGPIGLFAVQWALLLGAREVLAVDINAQKAALARQAGATMTANSAGEALSKSGGQFDVVIESGGAPATITLATQLAGRHSEVAFIGIPHQQICMDKGVFGHFLRHEVTLRGSWNSFSAPFPGREWTESAAALADGRLRWEFMITHQLTLAELPTMMRQLNERAVFSAKVLFLPEQ